MRPARAGLLDDLINTGRTIALFGGIVEPIIDRDRLLRVAQPQMRRLIFLVVGVRDEYRGEPVEGDLAVRSRVVDARCLAGPGQLDVIRMIVKRPRRVAAEHIGVEGGIGETAPKAPAEARPDIAYAAQLLPHPAAFEGGPDLGVCFPR